MDILSDVLICKDKSCRFCRRILTPIGEVHTCNHVKWRESSGEIPEIQTEPAEGLVRNMGYSIVKRKCTLKEIDRQKLLGMLQY